jgi:hypothetical protein
VEFAFLSAGRAGEVAGDASADQADRPRVGVVNAAREDTIVSAGWADAVGAHRVAFTAIDGNLRPFRARLIRRSMRLLLCPRSRLGEVMAGGVRIYAPRPPLPDQIG